MRWVWRSLGLVLLVALVGGGYFVYRTVWAKPFTFNMLLNRQAVVLLLDRPQWLTSIGIVDGSMVDFTSGKLNPYSLKDRAKGYARARLFEQEVRQWDRAKLTPQEQLSYDIALWSDERGLSDEKYPWLGANGSLYPVNQAFGIQKQLPNFLLSQHAITNVKLAHRYVDRLNAMADVLDAVTKDVARQAKMGVVPPDFIIDASVAQMKAFIAPPPQNNPLTTNLAKKTKALANVTDADKASIVSDGVQAVQKRVYPAYHRLIAEMLVLRKSATHDAGVWRLKGGDAYYADQLKYITSTDMTPAEIHQYGLDEVARISTQMDAILKSVGLTDGTVGERMDRLAIDPRFSYQNTEGDRIKMLTRYKTILAHVKTLLPLYFDHVPALPLDVKRVPPYAQKGSAGAYYEQPSLDGSRPGIFYANLRNVGETPMWAMPTLAYHEGLPGHHMQIATAMELKDLPYMRRFMFLPAYGEGWALYAERLANDMGLYKDDPYGNLGRLQAELFRAVRLVVDTGIHAKHWSREQAITYMQTTTGMAESDVTAEVERYVVWPGQACAYKLGMKTILDLREAAKQRLGKKFDIKAFHAVVLDNGAMPLWMLRRNVGGWIAAQSKANSAKAVAH